MLRGLVLVLLGLAVAGFGVCSLCGGVLGVAWMFGSSTRDQAYAPTAFFFFAVGGIIAALCALGFRALRRGGRRDRKRPVPAWTPSEDA